jgi:hypothetical protein
MMPSRHIHTLPMLCYVLIGKTVLRSVHRVWLDLGIVSGVLVMRMTRFQSTRIAATCSKKAVSPIPVEKNAGFLPSF